MQNDNTAGHLVTCSEDKACFQRAKVMVWAAGVIPINTTALHNVAVCVALHQFTFVSLKDMNRKLPSHADTVCLTSSGLYFLFPTMHILHLDRVHYKAYLWYICTVACLSCPLGLRHKTLFSKLLRDITCKSFSTVFG